MTYNIGLVIETPLFKPGFERMAVAKMLVIGDFGPDDLEMVITYQKMPENLKLSAKIQKDWEPMEKLGRFPGPLVRLMSLGLTDRNRLKVVLGETDYQEYVGSRDFYSLEIFSLENISNPLSVSAVLITSDKKLVFGRKVWGDAQGSIDAFGGYIHPQRDLNPDTGNIDLFKAALREVAEETPVSKDKITQMRLLGISYQYSSYDNQNRKYQGLAHPVAHLVMKTYLSSEEIWKLVREQDVDEMKIIISDPKEVPEVLLQNHPNRNPAAGLEPDGRITITLVRNWLKGGLLRKVINHESTGQKEISSSPFKFIGFDLDGTLVDTISEHLEIFGQYIYQKFGIDPSVAADHYRETSGLPTSEQISSLLDKYQFFQSKIEVLNAASEVDSKLEDAEGKPFEDVSEVLRKLKNSGFYTFVSSGHQTRAVGKILNRTGLGEFVDFFVGVEPDNPNFKKGEAHFRKIAEYFKVSFEEFVKKAIFIGDGTSDMEAASSANVVAIGRVGTKTKEELISAGARKTCRDLKNLMQILASIKKV